MLPEENGRKHKTAWNQLKVYVLWHRERNPRPKGRLILRTQNVKECVESICFWTQRTQKRIHQEHRQPKVWTVGRKIASAASGPCPAAQRRMLGLRRLRAARGDEVYDLDIMKSVVVEAAAYINCFIDPWAIAAEC